MHFVPANDVDLPQGVNLVTEPDRIRFLSPSGSGWVILVDGRVVAEREGEARIWLRRAKRWFRRNAVVEIGDRMADPSRLRKGDVIQAELGKWRIEWTFQPDANLSPVGRKAMALRGWVAAAFAFLVTASLVGKISDALIDIAEGPFGSRITTTIGKNAYELYPTAVDPYAHTYSPYLEAIRKANRERLDLDRFTREWIEKHGAAGQAIDAKAVREGQ